jgi:hypothetical protein
MQVKVGWGAQCLKNEKDNLRCLKTLPDGIRRRIGALLRRKGGGGPVSFPAIISSKLFMRSKKMTIFITT